MSIVNAPSRKNDVGMIADLLCLISQIVGVYAYAVTANEAGSEREKVPFAAGGLKYLLSVYT